MSLLRWIGVIASVISLLELARGGFDLTPGPFLIAVLQFYESMLARALGLLEPQLIAFLAFLDAQMNLDLRLQPEWKHIFVLTLLYFAAYARQAFGDRLYVTGLFESGIGFVIALACGVISSVALGLNASGMFIAMVPIIGILLFGVADSVWATTLLNPSTVPWQKTFKTMLLDDVVRLGFTLVPVLYFSNPARLAIFGRLPSPGLAVLATVVPALAFYHLWAGSTERTPLRTTEWQSFFARGHTKVGLDILAGLGLAASTVLLGI